MGNTLSMQMYDDIEKRGYSEKGRSQLKYVADLISEIMKIAVPIDEKYKFNANVVGSICEGTFIESSDIDLICYTKLAMCTDGSFHRYAFIVAETELDIEYPGYAFLYMKDDVLIQINPSVTEQRNGKHYLSSELFMAEQIKEAIETLKSDSYVQKCTIHGPALSLSVRTEYYEGNMDLTYGYIFHCPSLIGRFIERISSNGWLPECAKRKIAALPAFLVPTGHKSSELKRLQWRICFNFTETLLVHCMSDVQYKVFVLMKRYKKAKLEKICKEITSFVVKNVLFWMCEQFTADYFNRSNIFNIFIEALTILKGCISERKLDYYMIPERNLLDSVVTDTEKKQLIETLNSKINKSLMQILHAPIVPLFEAKNKRQYCSRLDMFKSLNCKRCKKLLTKKRQKNGKPIDLTHSCNKKRFKISEVAKEKRKKYIELDNLLKQMRK